MQTLTRESLAIVRGELKNVRETRRAEPSTFELREVPNGTGGTDLLYTGYACVTGVDYELQDYYGTYTERVAQGAFKRTLAEMPDVVFLLNHEGMSLARTKPQTLKLVEDNTGLHSEAKLDPINPHVIALRSAVERGDIDEMSFAFRVMSQTWDESYEDRTINEVNIHHGDVSAVNFGANPYTAGTVDLRGRKDHMEMNSARFLASLDDLIARSALDEDALLAIDERFGALRALAAAEQEIDEPPAAGRTVADARRRLSVALAAA